MCIPNVTLSRDIWNVTLSRDIQNVYLGGIWNVISSSLSRCSRHDQNPSKSKSISHLEIFYSRLTPAISHLLIFNQRVKNGTGSTGMETSHFRFVSSLEVRSCLGCRDIWKIGLSMDMQQYKMLFYLGIYKMSLMDVPNATLCKCFSQFSGFWRSSCFYNKKCKLYNKIEDFISFLFSSEFNNFYYFFLYYQ